MGFSQNPKLVRALAEIMICSYTLNNKAIVEPDTPGISSANPINTPAIK
jgi:hypothetical protein